jgi:hypothetical protein
LEKMLSDPALADQTSRSRILKRVQVDPRDLKADLHQLDAIVDDLRRSGGLYTPAVNWVVLGADRRPDEVEDGRPYLDEGFSEKAVAKQMSTMDKMLYAWIGDQRLPISADVVARYGQYVIAHDPLDLWTANVADVNVLAGYSVAELGSIIDLNIIYSYSATTARPTNVVLEIGGGYGRLAEAAFNVFGEAIKYVLVDSVPQSLLYAREYLRRACPWVRIGYYYDGDPFDLSIFDCYIVPSWHFEAVNNTTYDVCVNIESFQEMGQHQVDAYLTWFQDVACEGALIYLSNAHDFRFQGEWNYPVTWQRLLCSRIPRAWSHDHRTEVFVKGTRDYSAANAAIVATYEWNLAQARQPFPLIGPGARAKLLSRSPKANAKALLRLAKNRARTRNDRVRTRNERRKIESVFERAVAGDERAKQEFKSYWAGRAAV